MRAWRPLGRGWLSCGRRSTQKVFWRSWCARGRRWAAADFCVVDGLSWEKHNTGWLAHHLWNTIFETQSFTHNFVTHHLWHTIFITPSFTPLYHTLSFTHYLSHTTLSHTIFNTPPSLTHHFVTHHLSRTIFVTPLCYTPSFTHRLWHTTLSHTIFDITSLTHTIFHTQFYHTPSFLHLLLCLSFLPRPHYNISCSLLKEINLWDYQFLLFKIKNKNILYYIFIF